jgi:hypothetical protein
MSSGFNLVIVVLLATMVAGIACICIFFLKTGIFVLSFWSVGSFNIPSCVSRDPYNMGQKPGGGATSQRPEPKFDDYTLNYSGKQTKFLFIVDFIHSFEAK